MTHGPERDSYPPPPEEAISAANPRAAEDPVLFYAQREASTRQKLVEVEKAKARWLRAVLNAKTHCHPSTAAARAGAGML
jgi:hypothetical protein